MTNSIWIKELFYSLKGEGQYMGTPMYFLRLAGCDAAGRPDELVYTHLTKTQAFPCISWDGTKFYCDTDFHNDRLVDVDFVVRHLQSLPNGLNQLRRLVVTGGEPLMEKNLAFLLDLNVQLGRRGWMFHFETNGTKEVPPFSYPYWLACSPKQGWLPRTVQQSDELRIMIHSRTKLSDFPLQFLDHRNVFLSPINPSDGDFDPEALRNCMEMLKQQVNWRLNPQLHKYLGIP